MMRPVLPHRYVTHEDALAVVRVLLHQQMVVARVLKANLTKPHHRLANVDQQQRDMVLTKQRSHLLCVMITASRHRLHPAFARPVLGVNPTDFLAVRRDALVRQGDWVEHHTSWDYAWLQYLHGGKPMPSFMFGYRGYSGHWWFATQMACASLLPADYPYDVATAPLYVSEVWDALVGVRNPDARDAAVRLAGRAQGSGGRPTYHPWRR